MGHNLKKRIIVSAVQMNKSFEVLLQDGISILKGKSGDWLISSLDNAQWIVADCIFKKTYELVDN